MTKNGIQWATECAIGIAMTLLTIAFLQKLWEKRSLDTLRARFVLLVSGAVGILLLIVMKSWQMALEEKWNLGSHLAYGLCRRWGDVSFWAALIAIVLWGIVFVATSNPITLCSAQLRRGHVFSVGASAILYLILVAVEKPTPGTIFVNEPWDSALKWIQLFEGWLMLAWICISYFFIAQLLAALSTVKLESSSVRLVRIHSILAMAITVGVMLAFANSGKAFFSTFFDDYKMSKAPASGQILVYQLLLWWPLVVVFAKWLKVVAEDPTVLYR